MNESCHAHEWVMSHIIISHITSGERQAKRKLWWKAKAWHSKARVAHENVLQLVCNESCRIHGWVKQHMNESCKLWMSFVTYKWECGTWKCAPMGLQWFLPHLWMSHFTYEWVMWHVKMCCNGSPVSHATYANESCRKWMRHFTYEWVHTQLSLKTCSDGSAMSDLAYWWVMSHMNESCYIWMSEVTYELVIPRENESCHIWMSHITWMSRLHLQICSEGLQSVMSHMNEPRYIWMSHVTSMIESCHT